MADALLHAELLAACSALGYSDGIKYHKEADCLETTKDLVRYLRKDDESHEIRRALGDTRVVQTDLIPIIRDHSQDAELFDVILRLMVNLTNPAILLFREELPEEKVTRQQYLHLLSQQQGYKEAFVEEKVWSVLVGKLGELLQLEWENRQEDDKLIIERILILVRNILFVPASPEEEKRTEDDASIHDQVLWALHLAGFEDLLLYIASSQNEQELCMHSLEIISYMLREQDPSHLAKAGLQRSQSEKQKDEQDLFELRKQENIKKQQQRNKYYGARHSRFGGTYYVQNMKSISDRDIIAHRPLTDVKSINFDFAKRPKKKPKNLADMKDGLTPTRRSTLAIRLFLQEFCIEFLNGAYNSIMYTVKDNLDRARSQEHDESYYMWAIKFFMEFNRHHEFKVELVSETLSAQIFHYLQTNLENYYGMMTTDKKKIPFWSKRMHKALRAYQELLMTLACMDKSPTEDVREAGKVLKSKIFYVVEYREMILVLLQNYDRKKMSAMYLKDLIETAHIFLKLLEKFCGSNRHIIVQKKKKAPRPKKKKTAKKVVEEMTEDQLQLIWDDMSAEFSAIVQGEAGDLPETIPYDTLSDDSEEVKKENAMRKINAHLRKKEMAEALSLFRASREIWPEGDIFGSQTITPTEEFLSLREIFMANLNPQEPTQEDEDEEIDEEFEMEEEEERMETREEDFDLLSFVRRFAHTRVLQAYGQLFEKYSSNSPHTNHCILRMFHRIAWDSKLPAIFFQASLFCVFREAMNDPKQKTNEAIKEIVKFSKYIVREFFKTVESNPKVFAELFFWKNNKEALEIMCGYDGTSVGKEVAKRAWNEEEEDELRRLYQEFENAPMESLSSKDCVDLILDNLINQKRTRRGVIKKLKDIGLIENVKQLNPRKAVTVKPTRMWTEEEEGELRMLFEDNKDAMDIVGRIMDHMVLKRTKQRVIDKIMELGLVSDRKELRKKRTKKSPKAKKKRDTSDLGLRFLAANEASDHNSDESDQDVSSDGSDDESDEESSKRQKAPAKYVPPVATPGLIMKAMKSVTDSNMQDSLEWLAGLLQDVANDREEDGDFEPIPIVAITETSSDAMEDEKFIELLKLLGLQPPLQHQEMFWRVPSRLTVDALRKRVQYLRQGASGTNIEIPGSEEPLDPVEEVVTEKVKSKRKSDKKKPSQVSKAKTKKKTKGPKGKLSHVLEDSDVENMDPDDKENQPSSSGSTTLEQTFNSLLPTRNRLQQTVESSSDDDLPLSRQTGSSKRLDSDSESELVPSKNLKKRLGSDSESESDPSKNLKKRLGSDSESGVKKKRRVVIDDDESDNETMVVESQDLNLQMETETEADGPTMSRLESDDEDDAPLNVARQRVRAIIESDDDE